MEAEQQDDTETAEGLYERLLARMPEIEEAWFRMGVIRLEDGDFEGAEEAFEQALRLRPEWTDARMNLGLALWKLGQAEQAAKLFERVLAQEPESADVVRALAALAMERRDFGRALELQNRLGELGEPIWGLSYNLGLLHQSNGEAETAARFYRKALREKPDFAEALVSLNQTLEGLKQEARAETEKIAR